MPTSSEASKSSTILSPVIPNKRHPHLALNQARLKELLHYNPDTGIFNWLVRPTNSVKIGGIAGTLNNQGYIRTRIKGRDYQAHRLAWLYMHKTLPINEIDHINGIRDDNRLINLREATKTQCLRNQKIRSDNTSGLKGVSWDKDKEKWVARIQVSGKPKYLGPFTDKHEAHAAYCKAADKYFKEYANYG